MSTYDDYSHHENDHVPGEDDISEQDIRDVIEEMIDDGTIASDSAAYGIAKQYFDTLDFNALTDKQRYVFDRDILPELSKRTRRIGIQNYINRHPD